MEYAKTQNYLVKFAVNQKQILWNGYLRVEWAFKSGMGILARSTYINNNIDMGSR